MTLTDEINEEPQTSLQKIKFLVTPALMNLSF
jgi:hypothetical protein